MNANKKQLFRSAIVIHQLRRHFNLDHDDMRFDPTLNMAKFHSPILVTTLTGLHRNVKVAFKALTLEQSHK